MIEIVAEVDDERFALVEKGLEEFNAERSAALRAVHGLPDDGEEPLQVYALEDGVLVGGITGKTWAGWLHIELMWVAEEQRRAGLGGRLLRRAEEVARERGCTHSRVESWGFQAPEFYQGQGYTVFGVLEGYPAGETEYLLSKPL
ncbi:MAG TPA: GNAT family N-acetyltransferase [Thermomonospora sp.]|nr:GNAT family N-acetyltransferase [Thermomonospora sp.]